VNAPHILVIGESCIDRYIYGKAERLAPDTPAPVLIPLYTTKNKGMAANVVENLKNLGAQVDLITNESSLVKTRYVDDKTNHMFMRLDEGEDEVVPCGVVSSIDFSNYDAIIISDYCKGFLTEEDIELMCNAHSKVFVDTKKVVGDFVKNAFMIKINEQEWKNTQKYGTYKESDNIVITLGNKGCSYRGHTFSVDNVPVKDQSGAGDTFVAGLCYSYVKHNDINVAIKFANECAGKVVRTRGVSTV